MSNRVRGPCKAGHPVTDENTVQIGKAGYRCRICRRAIGRKHWHKRNDRLYPHLRAERALIAAAPELYEALYELRELIPLAVQRASGEAFPRAIRNADAILAKALGEQS